MSGQAIGPSEELACVAMRGLKSSTERLPALGAILRRQGVPAIEEERDLVSEHEQTIVDRVGDDEERARDAVLLQERSDQVEALAQAVVEADRGAPARRSDLTGLAFDDLVMGGKLEAALQ